MKQQAFRTRSRHPALGPGASESGYALLVVLGMMLIMVVASTAAVMMTRTNARRQREEEMIWRGKQYTRAVRLYYHKTGHYPLQLDDLTKGVPGVRFLRQSYKEPMNTADGSWRLIYINAAGQIIGSVRYASLQQMALLDLMDLNGGQLPTTATGLPGVPASSLGSIGTNPQPGQGIASGFGTLPTAPSPNQNLIASPDQSGQNPQSPSQFGQTGTPGQSGGSDQSGAFGQPGTNPLLLQKPTGPVSGPVLGAFITGVGGSDDGDLASIKIYHHGKKYKEWEFIWNPIEEQAAAAQQQAGTLGGQQPGQIGTPTAPGGFGGGTFGGPGGLNPSGPGFPQQSPNQPPQQ